jgi:hypothetical protein
MSPVTPHQFRWIQGASFLKTFTSQKGDGLGFCETCGTTMCGFCNGEVIGITLGSVVGESGVIIAEHIFVGSKADWDVIGGNAPQHAEFPGD